MAYAEPLCGWHWLQKHLRDYTQADIDSLSIVLTVDGREMPAVSQDRRYRGVVKDIVKSYRKERP